ncbi:polysaccharide deacetylase family protein [Pedobacter hiemivivus]|uniref:Polysaccharide deacetylase family protein n=1 Tax=Pedobacter hiemivivus TaxID=2530454 RepID=A0A4U1GEG2_9SPHI|nr:polysaccharide deacetylase family protein [Pedobacter hiemivivus]TCC95403.1 polysaccharide deacetylase family protein [Pedobacter hiemivivus]TKC61173.1 polysaccharide deacetylase family protein [Pedobacter hiemivivus]
MYLVKSPLLLKWYYPSLTWNKPRSEKIIYLTFDDGPIPDVTTFVLKTLKSFDAKATFFCIGDNIVKHPDVFELIKKEGHHIGNHTFNHLKGWKTEDKTYIKNFKACQQFTQTHLFRPPYGRIKKSQVSEIQSAFPETEIIMWDVLSGDFDINLSPQKCYENVIKNTRNGSIIVFHDSLKAFERLEYVLPLALKFFKEQGYEFGLL